MTRTSESLKIRFINHLADNHRVDFFGVPVVDLEMDAFLKQVEQHLLRRESTHVVNLNPHHFLIAQRDEQFAQICHSGDIVFTDGIGIKFASVLGDKFIQNRFTGLDLMKKVCALSSERGYSIFLLGGQHGIARQCADSLLREYPSLTIAGVNEPPFADSIEKYNNDEIIRQINVASPDVLFVALGAPKQEKWIEHFRTALQVPILMGVGGSFDIIGGRLPRAPGWMRAAGLEWLFRMGIEPRRLAPRYLIGIPQFILQALRLKLQSATDRRRS